MDESIWREIAARASSLDDRRSFLPFLDSGLPDEDLTQPRLQHWCQIVAGGDWQRFGKRLAWEDLDVATAQRLLGEWQLPAEIALPEWISTLQAAVARARSLSADGLEGDRSLELQAPIPFEELWLPFVQVARQRLQAILTGQEVRLSAGAIATLERSLLKTLSNLGGQCWYLEFSVFRELHPVTSEICPPPAVQGAETLPPFSPGRRVGDEGNLHSKQPSDPCLQYRAFVQQHLQDGLQSFFQEYSTLGRLAATTVDYWVGAIAEFLHHLNTDWQDLQQAFSSMGELGQVVVIESDLSDRHRQGHTVMAVTFASGVKLVYKPRNLAGEAAYFQFLDWLNRQGAPLPFKLLTVLNRQTHGWVEFVQPQACQDLAAVPRYYERSGWLLSVLYLLQATDCHRENLIAWGEHPVLVDMEALLYPRIRLGAEESEPLDSQWRMGQQFLNSVLRVGLLPVWQVDANGRSYDVSALGGVAGQVTSIQLPRWQAINTDVMGLRLEPTRLSSRQNLPTWDGVPVPLHDYGSAIAAGFVAGYQFLQTHRHALLKDSPLTALQTVGVRFVFRATRTYYYLHRKTLQPKFLRQGIDRSLELDVLSKALLTKGDRPLYWDLVPVERQALERLDVPLFLLMANQRDLPLEGDRTIANLFAESGYERAIAGLQRLSDPDLATQMGFLRGSLYAYQVAEPDVPTASSPVGSADLCDALPDDSFRLEPEILIEAAIAIAAILEQQAISGEDGSISWVGLTYLPTVQRMRFQPVEDSLYCGVAGIALFLAALHRITGEQRFADRAIAALKPLAPRLMDAASPRQEIGGLTGDASLIYSLTRLSQWLDQPQLLEVARHLGDRLTPEIISSDPRLDIVRGTAGTLLALLTLYDATEDAAYLEIARVAGNHLLQQRQTTPAGDRTWFTLKNKPLTGFSHGAAGIAYALLRLYGITRQPELLQAAAAAIAHEQRLFSPELGNWFDLRYEGDRAMTSWCHGAPGIGLARLGGLPVLDTPDIRQQIAIALKTTRHHSLHGIDQLCCGNFGRIDILLQAAQQLQQSDLLATAHRQTAWILARSQQVGGFSLFANLPPDVFIPGFFQGSSGIGYTLLRLVEPDRLPCILLWE